MPKFIIGVTGIPESGKSTFCKGLSVYTIDADGIGHILLRNPSVQKKLVQRWGTNIVSHNAAVARKNIAQIVFTDEKELQFLNSVMHPVMTKIIKNTIESAKATVIAIDAALLFEAGWDKLCTLTVCIICPPEIIASRTSNLAWKKMCSAQWRQGKKMRAADIVIDNSGSKKELFRSALDLVSRLRKN